MPILNHTYFINDEKASPALEMIFIAPILLGFILIMFDVFNYFSNMSKIQASHYNILNLVKNTTRYYNDSACIYGLNMLTSNADDISKDSTSLMIVSFSEISVKKTIYANFDASLETPKTIGYVIKRGPFGNFIYERGKGIRCKTTQGNLYKLPDTSSVTSGVTGSDPYSLNPVNYNGSFYKYALKGEFMPIYIPEPNEIFPNASISPDLSNKIRDLKAKSFNDSDLEAQIFKSMKLEYAIPNDTTSAQQVVANVPIMQLPNAINGYIYNRGTLNLNWLDLTIELPFYELALMNTSLNVPANPKATPTRTKTQSHNNPFKPSNDDLPYDQLYIHNTQDLAKAIGDQEGTFVMMSSLFEFKSILGSAITFITGYNMPKIYIKNNDIIFKTIETEPTILCQKNYMNRNDIPIAPECLAS